MADKSIDKSLEMLVAAGALITAGVSLPAVSGGVALGFQHFKETARSSTRFVVG
jgi:hypothetical protein